MAKVLIVDDEPNIREVVGLYLSRDGGDVVSATDGEEVVAVFRESEPDLVVLGVEESSRPTGRKVLSFGASIKNHLSVVCSFFDTLSRRLDLPDPTRRLDEVRFHQKAPKRAFLTRKEADVLLGAIEKRASGGGRR